VFLLTLLPPHLAPVPLLAEAALALVGLGCGGLLAGLPTLRLSLLSLSLFGLSLIQAQEVLLRVAGEGRGAGGGEGT